MQDQNSIGRFTILRTLGKGAMGVVYLGLDPAIDRFVAIKVLRGELLEDDTRERFMREAQSAGRLSHPNLVLIYDVGEHDGLPYIAMEYVQGQTLGQIVRDGEIAVARALDWMDQLCSGVGYAHQHGIVHRDIKPNNIIIQADGTLKVLDFGIARVAASTKTSSGMVLGTPAYLSPEQVRGDVVDSRADIFSIGTVFYEVLTGTQAFSGDTPAEILSATMSTPPAPIDTLKPAIDPHVASIVYRCLEKDPAARYQDLDEMRRDLRSVVRATDAPPQPSVPAPPAPARTPRIEPGRDAALARQRTEQMSVLLSEARQFLVRGDAANALQAVGSALMLGPDHREAEALYAEIEAVVRDREASALLKAAMPSPPIAPTAPPPAAVPARPEGVVIPLTAPPSHQPSEAAAGHHFIARSGELTAMAGQIIAGEGGSFLITGYRGVGKTSFVNHLLDRVKQEFDGKRTKRLIVIRLNLTKRLRPVQLMHLIIKALADELEALELDEQLPPKVRVRLGEAVRRTSFEIRVTSGVESESTIGGELSAAGAIVSSKVTGEQKDKVSKGEELKPLDYDEQRAEADVIKIAKLLAAGVAPAISWWRRWLAAFGGGSAGAMTFKVIFVFDELDKLDQFARSGQTAALDVIFSSLKSLLTTSRITFLFVGGRDMQQRWQEDVTRGDSIYQSVFSYHTYLPCLWDDVPALCVSYLSPTSSAEPLVLDHFKGFIGYAGRGIPRLGLDAMKQYMRWESGPPTLTLSPEDLRTLSFYSGLADVLRKEFAEGDRRSVARHVERDQQRLGAHYLVDWILCRGDAEFTHREARDAILALNPNIAPSETAAGPLTERVLNVLVREDYVNAAGAKGSDRQLDDLQSGDLARFKLSPRRMAELGGRAVTRTDDEETPAGPSFPSSVGDFVIEERIGEGGMGVVFRARDTKRPRRAAVKLLKPSVRASDIARARFAREADVLRRLAHPGIVRFYDAALDGDWPFIAMELVDGTPLNRLLKASGTLSAGVAVGLVTEVADALDYVHGLGFVRNDIKPENIFVMPDGHAKLIDFGISKQAGQASDLTMAGAFIGTPNYAAPELWQHRAIDRRADVYAVGAVLYELVTGHVPFEKDERQALRAAHLLETPTPPSSHGEIAPALEAAIVKALAKEPAARFPSMAAFREALATVDQPERDALKELVAASERKARAAAGATMYGRADELVAVARSAAASAPPAPRPVDLPRGPMLLVGDSKQTRRILTLKTGRNVIGRDADADIVLSGPSVSRFHTVITLDEDGVYVEDLNSANGTLVNDEPIRQRSKIAFGDHLVVGDVELELSQLPLESATRH